ncbi:uncharacterized protein L201_006408 [Kwoniella dendrophila CBS 6074]|uniref:Uncharacterized protein n=1 Tax=Kwoniella dendrophila CBS 6074 TaxID=1295534 RepID=A0AAX4K1N9_9TREE
MPYIPPGSNQIQSISIPIHKTHQLAVDNIPKDIRPEEEEIHTPKPSDMDNMNTQSINIPQKEKEDSIDSLNSALLATSLYSTSSTPPLEHDHDHHHIEHREDICQSSSSSSIRDIQYTSSPADSSVISLPEQDQDNENSQVKTSRSDSSLRRRQTELNDEDESEEGKKVAGEDITSEIVDPAVQKIHVNHEEVKNAVTLYKEAIYAYTHGLWIQAKLSSSRAERRRQSVSSGGQFGSKQSGMEKMAAKKALAKRLNG